MKAIKATFENGRVSLAEPAPEQGPVEVVIVFPNGEADAWDWIMSDTRQRPALDEMIRQVEEEAAAGKAKPLDLNEL